MHKIESVQMPPFDRSISPCRDVLEDDIVQKEKRQSPASPISSTTSKTSSTSSSSFLSSSSTEARQQQEKNVNNNNNCTRNTSLSKKDVVTSKATIIGGFLATTSRRLAVAATTKIQEHVEHYREYKHVLSNLETSLYSLIDLLQRKGVANGCIVLLRKQIKTASSSTSTTSSTCSNKTNTNNSNNSNINNNNHQSSASTSPNNSSSVPSQGNNTNSSVISVYVQILQQCQQYAEILVANMSSLATTTNMSASNTPAVSVSVSVTHMIDMESMNQMIISCWSQLYVYASYQYKQAYKSYNTIRDKIIERRQAILNHNNNNNATGTCNPILTCSDDFVGSEYNTVTPQSLSESQHRQQQQSQSSSPLNNFLQYPLHIQIERASRYQNQLAEECCSVQKYLLLAQLYERKQRCQLQKLRKIQSQQQQLQSQQQQQLVNKGQ